MLICQVSGWLKKNRDIFPKPPPNGTSHWLSLGARQFAVMIGADVRNQPCLKFLVTEYCARNWFTRVRPWLPANDQMLLEMTPMVQWGHGHESTCPKGPTFWSTEEHRRLANRPPGRLLLQEVARPGWRDEGICAREGVAAELDIVNCSVVYWA